MILETIKPTGDRKTRFYNSQKNTFGLLPGIEGSCPCATTAEGGCWNIPKGRKTPNCYVAGTMSAYSGVKGVLEHNTRILMTATREIKELILIAEFDRFYRAELKRKAKGLPYSLKYRLHWSGDIFNEDYAWALKVAITLFPGIEFWGYTRSFFAVPILCDLPNLVLYLSLDPVNVQAGLSAFNENKTTTNKLQICYMSKTNDFANHLSRTQQILDEENKLRKIMKQEQKENWAAKSVLRDCPVDAGRMLLDGGCAKCGGCICDKPRAVWFET